MSEEGKKKRRKEGEAARRERSRENKGCATETFKIPVPNKSILKMVIP
jgi:hypothetical protein